MDGIILQVVEDEWGTMMSFPTTIGKVVFTLVIALAILFAMLFIRASGKQATVSKLALCVFIIGLSSILAYIRVISFPTGGAVTLFSMLMIMLPAYWFGPGTGFMICFAYGVFQMLIDPYLITLIQVLVDYIFAFGIMGVCGFFSNSKYGLIKGYFAGVIGRFFFSVISGWIFFGEYAWEGWDPLPYSLAYNAIYIFAEAGITIAILLIPPVRRGFEAFKIWVIEDESRVREQERGGF